MSETIKPATATVAEKQLISEEVTQAKPAWHNLLLGLGLVLLTGAGQFMQSVAPDLAAILLGILPGWGTVIVGPYLNTVLLAAAAWHIKRGRSQSTVAVVEALRTPLPPPVSEARKYYDKK